MTDFNNKRCKFFVAFFLVNFFPGNYLTHGQVPFEPIAINSIVHTLFKYFEVCHYKYFLDYNDISIFDIPPALINNLSQVAIFSLENLQFNNGTYYDIPPEYNHQRVRRFSQCFVHLYMANNWETYIMPKMYQSEILGEKPNHFIYFEQNLEDGRTTPMFTEYLLMTFAMGIILRIVNLSEIYIVCLSFKDNPFHSIFNGNQLQNLDILWTSIHTNLHGVHIRGFDASRNKELGNLCEKFASDVPNTSEKLSMQVCIHKIFGEKLNYTTSGPKLVSNGNWTRLKYPEGAATLSHYICEPNVASITSRNVPMFEWIPYSIRYTSFKFATIVRKPGFHATALVEPFDIISWVILLTLCLSIIVISCISFQFARKTLDAKDVRNFDFSKSLIKVCGSILDQPVLNIGSGTSFINDAISTCWLLWFLMLLVLGQFYKGTLFSYLAKSSEPSWPSNVNQLVDNLDDYVLITLSTATNYIGRFSILKDKMQEYLNRENETNLAHRKIEENLNYFPNKWCKLVLEIFAKNHQYLEIESNYNLTFDIPGTNIVVIDDSETVDLLSIVVPLLTPNNVMSTSLPFNGYDIITPWEVRRSYFFPVFVNTLTLFHESGLQEKIKQHIVSVSKRMMLQNFTRIIKSNFSLKTTLSQSQLYFLSTYGSKNFYNKLGSFTPLSFTTLQAVFILLVMVLSAGLITFVLEYLRAKCGHRKMYKKLL